MFRPPNLQTINFFHRVRQVWRLRTWNLNQPRLIYAAAITACEKSREWEQVAYSLVLQPIACKSAVDGAVKTNPANPCTQPRQAPTSSSPEFHCQCRVRHTFCVCALQNRHSSNESFCSCLAYRNLRQDLPWPSVVNVSLGCATCFQPLGHGHICHFTSPTSINHHLHTIELVTLLRELSHAGGKKK